MAATTLAAIGNINDDDDDDDDDDDIAEQKSVVAAAAEEEELTLETTTIKTNHHHQQQQQQQRPYSNRRNSNNNSNNGANNSDYATGAADSSSILTITCASCKITVQESDNRRRTICPHCGNFLSEELEREVRMVATGGGGNNNNTHHRALPSNNLSQQQQQRSQPPPQRLKSSRSNNASSRAPTANSRNKQQQQQQQGNMTNSTTLPRIDDSHRATPQLNRPSNSRTPLQPASGNAPPSSAERSPGPFQALKSFFRKLGPNNSGGKRDSADSGNSGGGTKNNKTTPRGQVPPARLPPLTKSTSSNAALSQVPINPPAAKPAIVPIVEKRLTPDQLNALYEECNSSDNWDKLTEFYQRTFSSVVEINAIFKDFDSEKDSRHSSCNDACIKQDLLKVAYQLLESSPKEIHSATFRSIIDLLVDNNKSLNAHSSLGSGRDDVRALLIVLQNPLFKEPAHSIVFAHLLRQISSITQFQHCLVLWLRHLDPAIFLQVTKTINAFITRRLFGDSTLPSHVLPPADKCAWWIPSGVKVLAIFNAANNATPSSSENNNGGGSSSTVASHNKGVVPYSEFYNASLELLDLGTQYKMWLSSSGEKNRFSFCQYPFIMTLAAKRAILEADSEHQMVLNAQRSLIMDVVGGERVGLETFFLNLQIRRSFLLDDSIDELSHKSSDLKKKLRVNFVGEPGLDVGGLTKEWFLLLMEKIFSPDYGMFVYNKISGMFWLSSALLENFQEFHLVGVLMGLAVYNGIILDLRFPPILYRKLLSPAVCPFDNPNATVGVCACNVSDLETVFPDVAHGLKELLTYEGDVEEDFGLTFQITSNELGAVKTSELKRGGKTQPVTNANREEYVNLYVDWLLNRSIYRQFRAFYFGFHSVCASNAILLFRPEEIESLVCGSPIVDVAKLRRVTEYENGYSRDSVTVQHFWAIVSELSQEQLKKLLFFITSCTRVPIGCDLALKVVRADNLAMLPMAQTCFNRLFLPDYKDEKLLQERLLIALNNAEGFGIE